MMCCSFKLQFYVDPEDRWYPNYPTRAAISTAASRLLAEDPHIPSDEPTQSTDSSSSSSVSAPELPERPITPAATEPADSRPSTPRQQELGDGFGVVPGPSHRLQRERPFSVAPDPMWNSTREINPFERLAGPAPPPPYVSPPMYAEVVPVDIDTGTATAAPTLTVQIAHESSSALQPAVEEEEVEVTLSTNFTASTSTTSTDDTSISSLPSPVASPHPSAATGDLSNGAVDANSRPSSPIASTSTAGDLSISGVGAVHDDPDLAQPSQLSEKARGKKRVRELDDMLADDEEEALERLLLGEGSSGTSSRDGEPDRKRIKTDTTINTDRLLNLSPAAVLFARVGLAERLTPDEHRRQTEKLKAIQKLYRSGRDSY